MQLVAVNNYAYRSNPNAMEEAQNRTAFLKSLSDAYDAFQEIKGNLEEGSKFYNDFLQACSCFVTFCMSTKTVNHSTVLY